MHAPNTRLERAEDIAHAWPDCGRFERPEKAEETLKKRWRSAEKTLA